MGAERFPCAKKDELLWLIAVLEWCPSAKENDLLPLVVVSERRPSAKKYGLLPLFVVSKWWSSAKICCRCLWFRSGVPVLRGTICFRCCGLEMVPECYEVRFFAVVCVFEVVPQC